MKKSISQIIKDDKSSPLTLKKMKKSKNATPKMQYKTLFQVSLYESSQVRVVNFYKPISKL
ncbi:hypothetical protein Fluta_3364 [Fluviicola taffensis DSM 16823]|uniref:Uncharacterized protein n=1 Tax=Fluviicola taffensis (strain DSM 16823 / NCIMB 13979 / RW262) TaxID=755732 RepID=F2IBL0_FLUTR|nr:hypothetical protein Fluta_3364 [Fluviicola taffensis DSM 16823]